VNGELISVKEANNLGIVSSVSSQNGEDILLGTATIDPGTDFVVEIADITGSPIALLK
jgi:hypothetical protein